MITTPTRRRFIAIMPIAGAAFLAACSPEPQAVPAPASPPAPAAENAATPAPAPAAAPTPAPVAAANMPMVDPKDPQAMALGYVDNTSKADQAKYPNHANANQCSNCALYLGKTSEASGGCPLFAGKKVMAKGWCASWVKKA